MMQKEEKIIIKDSKIRDAITFCVEQTRQNLKEFTYHFPGATSEQLFYRPCENIDWTNGFWTGLLWLSYEFSKEECFRNAAMEQVDSFHVRIINRICVDHHDMGFLYSLSCVAAYKLTGDVKAKEAALMAADNLMSRYQPVGEFIQAWGRLGTEENYRLIIDCMMNVPLLFWAHEVTGKTEYRRVAENHIQTTVECVFREDDSAYHTVFFNKEDGKPMKGVSHQGYSNGSAWARGQAWGIYGCAMAYKYTGKEKYIDTFKKATEYYLRHLPEDRIPFWDLCFDDFSGEPRDSSAAAIAVCGMLEMAKYLEEADAKRYRQSAGEILKMLYSGYAVKDSGISNGLLLHGTYAKSSPYNTCSDRGVDECTIWGDYFYMEALMRVHGKWEPYW